MTFPSNRNLAKHAPHLLRTAEAARNVALKKQYPTIDDPVKAIAFAIDRNDNDSAMAFLCCWQEGDWVGVERDWPDFLRSLVS